MKRELIVEIMKADEKSDLYGEPKVKLYDWSNIYST